MISSILKWVQCFSIYFSVIALKEPQRAPDLLSYMNLIIKAHLEYSGDAWQGYDQSFKQRAAMTTKMQWATTDPTLRNLAFAGHANAKRCKYCFGLYHSHNSCDWAPEPATASFKHQPTPQPFLTSTCRRYHICLTWNNAPSPNCSFPGYKYERICCICAKIPTATDLAHKAIYCAHQNENHYTGRQLFNVSQS